jgi:hypothetical protein
VKTRAPTSPARLLEKSRIDRLRNASTTVDIAVYNATTGIDVFRDQDRFDCAQNSAAVVAIVLVALGWPS